MGCGIITFFFLSPGAAARRSMRDGAREREGEEDEEAGGCEEGVRKEGVRLEGEAC